MIDRMRERNQAKILLAYIERRKRLTMKIRAENPLYSEMQLEARLEMFGA